MKEMIGIFFIGDGCQPVSRLIGASGSHKKAKKFAKGKGYFGSDASLRNIMTVEKDGKIYEVKQDISELVI